jgi:hypothetical protein
MYTTESPHYQAVVSKFEPGQNGNFECSNHDDNEASLTITLKEDGKITMYCHAGCDTAAVLQSAGLSWRHLFPDSGLEWVWEDADGKPLYKHQHKGPWYKLNGKGEYVKGQPPLAERVPYHLKDVDRGIGVGETIIWVEGERDVETEREIGLTATTSGGATTMSKPEAREHYAQYVEGADVVILSDNDGPGYRFAANSAEAFIGVAKSVRYLQLEGLEEHEDVTDWLSKKGNTADKLRELINSAPTADPEAIRAKAQTSSQEPEAEKAKRNQADRLVHYALASGADLFVDQFNDPHALVDGEPIPLNSRSYPWLRSLIWETENRTVNAEALKTASGTLAAFALGEGEIRKLHTRAAFHDGAVYYWLGTNRVVRIDRGGWELVTDPPVLFRMVPNLKELPNPERGGSLAALEALLNLKEERDMRLFIAYMVTLPIEDLPRPILQPTGVMGSGKSTLCRAVKRTLDPTVPEAVRVDPRDFLQKASHSYIVMLDNQNSLPGWAVDIICRLVTGEGDSKRKHYTDDEDFIYELKRGVLLNGINPPADRGDAQDRTLPIELERIPGNQRKAEAALWGAFDAAHGKILGALFDALSQTLERRESIELSEPPRLADWGYYVAAVYEVWGWGVNQFVADWRDIVKEQNWETFEGSAVAQAILEIMKVHNEYRAPASKLLKDLETEADKLNIDTKRDKSWPGSPTWVWRRIREVMPLLESLGITAEQDRDQSRRDIVLRGGSGDSNPPKNDSRNKDAVMDAVISEPAKTKGNDSSDSNDSRYGGLFPSLTSDVKSRATGQDKGKNAETTSKNDTPREVPRNAVTAVMLSPDEQVMLEICRKIAAENRNGRIEPGKLRQNWGQRGMPHDAFYPTLEALEKLGRLSKDPAVFWCYQLSEDPA